MLNGKNREQTTIDGLGLPKDVRLAFEPIMRAFSKSDETLLPNRIDMGCRENLKRQIKRFKNHNVGRLITFSSSCQMGLNDARKPGWKKTNEGGREWRTVEIYGPMSDNFVNLNTGEKISERLLRHSSVSLIQSRRIRASDRKKDKKVYYSEHEKITCQSCGETISRSADLIKCPYCGAHIESRFFDWQLESFEIGKYRGPKGRKYLLLALIPIIFTIIFMIMAEDWYDGVLPGLFTGGVICLLVIVYIAFIKKDIRENIVRYSENILRENIADYIRETNTDKDLLDISLEEFNLKKVTNSDTQTQIEVKAYICLHIYKGQGKIDWKRQTKKFSLKRARYPDRMKAKGDIFEERICPSCGADYSPDSNGDCSFCGYGLYVQNRNWIIEGEKQ